MLRTDRYPCTPTSMFCMRSAARNPADLWIHPIKLAAISAPVAILIFFLLLLPCIARSSRWKLRYLPFHVRGIEQTRSLFYFVNILLNVITCPRCRHLRNCLGAEQHFRTITTLSCLTYHEYFQPTDKFRQKHASSPTTLPSPTPPTSSTSSPLASTICTIISKLYGRLSTRQPSRTNTGSLSIQLATQTGSSGSVICSRKLISRVDLTYPIGPGVELAQTYGTV